MSEQICQDNLSLNDPPNEDDTEPNKDQQDQHANNKESMSPIPLQMGDAEPLKPESVNSDAKPVEKKMSPIGEKSGKSPLAKSPQFSSPRKDPSDFMNKDQPLNREVEKMPNQIFPIRKVNGNGQKRREILLNLKKEVSPGTNSIKKNPSDSMKRSEENREKEREVMNNLKGLTVENDSGRQGAENLQEQEQDGIVKLSSHVNSKEEFKRPVIGRKPQMCQSAPIDLREMWKVPIEEADDEEEGQVENGALKSLHPQEESSEMPHNAFWTRDENNKIQGKINRPVKTEPFLSPIKKGSLDDSLSSDFNLNDETNFTENLEALERAEEEAFLSFEMLNKHESSQSQVGSGKKQKKPSFEPEKLLEKFEESLRSLREEMSVIKWQISSSQEETEKSRQQNLDKKISEDIQHHKKNDELEKRISDLKKEAGELRESFKEKEDMYQEEARQLQERLRTTEEKLRTTEEIAIQLTKMYKNLEAEMKVIHEEQYRQNNVMGVDRREEINKKYSSLAHQPYYYLEFCQVFYFQLSSLFTNSISVSFLSIGIIPSKRISPKTFQLSQNLFSLIPYAGQFLSAGIGVLETIYDEVKESQSLKRALNIRRILAKYFNFYSSDDINLLAAAIAFDITLGVGCQLQVLMKSVERLNSSRLHKLKTKISGKDLSPEMQIAIAAFEYLLHIFDSIVPAKFQAKTEAEFKNYCVNTTVKGDWYKRFGK